MKKNELTGGMMIRLIGNELDYENDRKPASSDWRTSYPQRIRGSRIFMD